MRLATKFSSLVPSIHWPSYDGNNGDTVSSFRLPMSYQPLSQLVEWRRKDESIRKNNNLASVLLDIPQSVDELTSCVQSDEEEHYGILSLACILLGHGFADEAHDLVTPLSWPEDTYFGYLSKPTSTYHSTSVGVIASASYIHSLIHRYEGFEIGEYGMMGYANSNYWMNSALSSSIHLQELLHNIQQAVKSHVDVHYHKDNGIQTWCQDNFTGMNHNSLSWDPKVLIQLCQNVQRKASNNQNVDPDFVVLSQFSQECCEIELRQILNHCLKHAGYDEENDNYVNTAMDDCFSNIPTVTEEIDTYLAQKVANKISFAHMQSFQSNGQVLLRRVWDPTTDNKKISSCSVACGVACRLLDTCGISETLLDPKDGEKITDDEKIIFIQLPTMETILEDGRSMACGDILAKRYKAEKMKGDISYVFQSCSPEDGAIFTDRFHGSRGSTPTTVIQWSKGTIF